MGAIAVGILGFLGMQIPAAAAAATPVPCVDAFRASTARTLFVAPREAKEALRIPGLASIFGSGKAASVRIVPTASTDALVAAYLEVQRLRLACRDDAAFANLATEVQWEFLRRRWKRTPTRDGDLLFRMLIGEPGVPSPQKVKMVAEAAADHVGIKALARRLYGAYTLSQGIPIFGSETAAAALTQLVRAGDGDRRTRFWEPLVLQRVLIVPTSGLAAFSTETQSLVLSANLLVPKTTLGSWAVWHELAHAAALTALHETGRDWAEEFAAFSGWGRDGTRVNELGARADALAAEAATLKLPWLPDPALGTQNAAGEKLDGFVAAKTYREAQRQGVDEDLADHIAAYLVAPARFCFRGEPLAPRKWDWIGKNVFGRTIPLRCVATGAYPGR